jgi:phage shock protein PspC (stress-responsive transcriptional regulator)
MENKKLYRSRRDRRVAGVCGGIAEYLGVDPTWVRVAFLLATLAGGPGVLIYIVLWMVMPEQAEVQSDLDEGVPDQDVPEKPKRRVV